MHQYRNIHKVKGIRKFTKLLLTKLSKVSTYTHDAENISMSNKLTKVNLWKSIQNFSETQFIKQKNGMNGYKTENV